MAENKGYSEIKVVRIGEAENKDGKKFSTYKTVIAGNKLMDLCFVRTVKNTPEEPCIIVVEDGKWNIDRKSLYPRVWVKEIKEIKPLPRKEEENPFI